MSLNRRRFLAAAAGLPLAGLLRAQPPAAPGRIERVHAPQNLETNFAGLSDFITPNDVFYVRNHFAQHRLTVGVRPIGTRRVGLLGVDRGGHRPIRPNAFAESRRDIVDHGKLISDLPSIGRNIEIERRHFAGKDTSVVGIRPSLRPHIDLLR